MRLVLALLWCIAALPAFAQSPEGINGPQPVAVFDFTQMRSLSAAWTVTRATTEIDFACTTGAPVATTFGVNTPALGVCAQGTGQQIGLGVWPSYTIANKWARDLTQTSFWTTTNTTAALSATGIDAVATDASLLTATANGGMICSAIIGVSLQQRVLSMFLKRVTGTGTISISQDGANWTDVTAQVGSGSYTRVPGGGHYQTATNSIACIKLGTSGDQIDVDGVNVEVDNNNNHFAPTPVVFTVGTPNVVQSADSMSILLASIPGLTPDRFTVVVTSMLPVWPGAGGVIPALNRGILQIDDGTNSNSIYLRYQPQQYNNSGYDNDFNVSTELNGGVPSGTGKARCSTITSGLLGFLAPLPAAFSVLAAGYDVNSGMGVACSNGVQSGSQPEITAAQPGFVSGQMTRLLLGPGTIGTLAGYIQRIAFYNGRLTSQALTAAVALGVPRVQNRHPGFIP